MLKKTIFLLAITFACQAIPSSNDEAIDQIYHNVVVADYRDAVSAAVDLENSGRGSLIKEAVEKLLVEGRRNVMDFTNNLWNSGHDDIVKKYFPFQLNIIFGGEPTTLVFFRDFMVLKLGGAVDKDGDRRAYGDSKHLIGERSAWRINPISDSESVYFYIYNIQNNQFLKLAIPTDRDGDHEAYGGTGHSQYREQWYLKPVRNDGTILFYIFNREYNQALKMSRALDRDGDRRVLSEAGNQVDGHPQAFGWLVAPFLNRTDHL